MNTTNALKNNLATNEIVAAHVIAHEEPMLFQAALDKFCAGKKVGNIVINSTPIMTGIQNVGGQHLAQMKIIISAYIQWSCTQDEYNSFLFEQKTMLGR